MKPIFLTSAILALAVSNGIVNADSHTQPDAEDTTWADVTYIKVSEDTSISEYVEKRGVLVKRAYDHAKEEGLILSWRLFVVEGSEDYDLVSIKAGQSLDDLAKLAGPGLLNYLGELSAAEEATWKNYESMKTTVLADTYWIESSVSQEPAPIGAPITVRYVKAKPGHFETYRLVARDLFRKLHTVHVEEGRLGAWHFAGRYLPRGRASDYDFVAFKQFPLTAVDLEDPFLGQELDERARAALTDDEWEKVRSVDSMRDVVHQVVWRRAL